MFNFTTKQKWVINGSLLGLTLVALIGLLLYLLKFLIPAIVLLSIAGIGFFVLMIVWLVFERYNKKKG
ncbi:MAG: hypothetical protein EIB84_04495 [Spiroplasma poulsonii]|uniref:Uncharacterized protein n=1 Tax=Spiroplasma poulsonii TaxID=2138 RepID=A0A2P6FEP0_9MOLU|nr:MULTISPECIES: hypothetical protein [Spiroplasma]KAF0850276.1 hypothetical protein MSROBK_018260 [Spiroplasma poulsonii]MBH8623047.1 hypothetical protein [Spiroplasma sp. hyd1]MBW1242089.1 hypothetical protein [Spiroplasma poulsonii]MBW3058559.1 hypothetical protein [Spiroplasma poulsonii]PQM31925.1 hypothetical protein SMSRO_SF017880 [Spiroplasma poulsonii]